MVTIEEEGKDESPNDDLDHSRSNSQSKSSHGSHGSQCKKKKRRRRTGQQANHEFDADLVNDYRNHMKLSDYQKRADRQQSFAKKRAKTTMLDEVLSTSNYQDTEENQISLKRSPFYELSFKHKKHNKASAA